MFKKYKVPGMDKPFDVEDIHVAQFLEKFPDAELIEDTVSTPTETVTQEEAVPAQPPVSTLGPISNPPIETVNQPEMGPINQPVSTQKEEEDEEVASVEDMEYDAVTQEAYRMLMEKYPEKFPTKKPEPGEPGYQGEIKQKANIYEKRFSKKQLAQQKKKEEEHAAASQGKLTPGESRINSLGNALGTLATVDDRMKYLYGTVMDDPKARAEAALEINKQEKLRNAPTVGFTDIKGDDDIFTKIDKGAAAGLNAVTAFGTSMATAKLTFGVGLAAEMIGGSIKSYNDTKAKDQGLTTEELIAKGDNEIVLPAIGGFFLYKLEHFGLKGMNAKFIKTLGGVTNRNLRTAFQTLAGSTREGLTEYAQGAGETYMNEIAKDKSNSEAALTTLKWLGSKEGLESLYQGMAGGGAFKMGNQVRNKVNTQIADNRSDLDKETIKKNRKIINSLEDQKYRRGTTAEEIEAINAAQAIYQEEITSATQKPYAVLKNTTIKERNEVFAINENIKKLQQQILTTEKNDKLSPQKKNNIIKGLEVQVTNMKSSAQSIIDTANERKFSQYQTLVDQAREADKEQSKKTGKKVNTAENKIKKEIDKDQDQNPIVLFMAPYVKAEKEAAKGKEPKTIKEEVIQQWEKTNEDLKSKFKRKEITEKQYNADRKKNENNLKVELEKIKTETTKINKVDEDISKSNILASEKTQEIFDKGVKEGEIKKDKAGKNTFSSKAISGIKKLQEKLVNKIVNSKFSLVPDMMIIGDKETAKNNFKANVEYELFELLRDYDSNSKVPLAAWLQKRLPQRSNRAFKGVTNDKYYQQLESSEVQGLISEEDAGVDATVKNINTAEELGVGGKLMNTIKNTAKKALLTAKQGVDNLKFKSDIAKSFKDDLYNEIKKELGLKNTKKNKGLTKAIEKNPVAFYDAVSVESMRMARTKDGKNPFEEAGFLVRNKNGVLEKKKYSPKIGMDFIYYFNDANLKASTRSDRQMNLVEALATSMGAREAISLLENDIEFRQQFAEQQQKEKEKTIFEKAVDKIKSIPKGLTEKLVKQLAEVSSAKNVNAVTKLLGLTNKITVNDSNREAKQKSILKGIKDGKIPSIVFISGKFANFARRKVDGVYVDLPARGGLYYGVTDPAYQTALKAAQQNDKLYPNLKKSLRITIPKGQKITKEFVKKYQERAKDNMNTLESFATILQDAVHKYNVPLEDALLFISSSYQATTGIIKAAAPFKYVSKNFEHDPTGKVSDRTGEKYREEHNPPASVIGATLMWAIANNKVGAIMPSIRKNYYQTQLSKKDDGKIDKAKLAEVLPEGATIIDNPIIRLAKAGIDLNSIINPLTGKTLAQENNVESPNTVDGIAASNEAAIENNSDQVENLIDRAIAKLTELTGSKGTLQMNLATIPVQTIIGALRTVKLAYQGGKALAQAIDMGYKKIKDYMSAQEWADFVAKSTQEVRNQNNPADVKLAILSEKGVEQMQEQSRKEDEKLLKEFGIDIEGLTTDQIVEKLSILRKAKSEASNTKNPTKKARVFDFDDTLAKTDSKVLYTLPDGTEGSLDATQFAEEYNSLKEAGATFDYSEFNQVKKGSKGPLANLAKRFTEAAGDRDVFVLTARPNEAAEAIQEFLRSTLGISIPLKNITGLENGTPGAKAMWIAEKVSEGYNDIFFADDSKSNVEAVEKMLTDLGVTNRVQQAKEDGQKTLEDEMDSLVRTNKRSKIGTLLNKLNIYVPPGADDFSGLLQYFIGKGKAGEQQQKWFQDNLLNPFAKGISAWTSAKVSLANDYKNLKKRFKKNKKLLAKKVLGGLYTNEQAVRAYLYDKAGQELGLNKADTQDLIALVEGNADLKAFADELSKITKLENGYPKITKEWLGGNIATDLANVANTDLRNTFLQDFINNKNQIFSEQNLKLIKQAYGNDFTNALENTLERMTSGINRKKGKDKEFNSVMNWINQSVGAVMAVNMRSAVLQQLSIVNYTNWGFNNPFMMAKAMANVPQFLSDYVKIFNSPFLKQRRGGMAIDVNLSDVADSNPGNLFLRMNKKLIELGFKPTQWGDSNAISFGGATWYRNRLNQLLKQGVSEKEAEEQTMREFQELTEETQQSSRPDRIARQQASDIGRLILAFANTPLQYARLTKKAALDLINNRGDWKTNASKILYYGIAQNIIFTALQQGLFSLLMDDDDEIDEKEEKKISYAVNGVFDGMLRGMGYAGATIAALKNLAMEYYDQYQKKKEGKRVYDGTLKLIQKGASISPPISKKIGDIVEGQKFETWRQYKSDPFYQAFAYANYMSGLTNVPIDRLFKKAENLKAASDDKTEAWQSIFLSLGWSPYNVDVQWPEKLPKKTKKKKKRVGPPQLLKPPKLKTVKPKKVRPLYKREVKILGKAHKDGTIEIAPGLSPEKRKQVERHEEQHGKDMREGKLDYSKDWVRWGKYHYKRTSDQKIVYNGKKYIEGHPKLPWEIAANKAESKVS